MPPLSLVGHDFGILERVRPTSSKKVAVFWEGNWSSKIDEILCALLVGKSAPINLVRKLFEEESHIKY